jgi:hypothetical protein
MEEVQLSHSGPSTVYLTGYRVEQLLGGSEEEDEYLLGGFGRLGVAAGSGQAAVGHKSFALCGPLGLVWSVHLVGAGSDEEESEEEGVESDDDEAPLAVPLQRNGPARKRLARLLDDEAEEASEDEGGEGEPLHSRAGRACWLSLLLQNDFAESRICWWRATAQRSQLIGRSRGLAVRGQGLTDCLQAKAVMSRGAGARRSVRSQMGGWWTLQVSHG